MATPDQLKKIHALRREAGLDDDSYRDLLQAVTGERSAKAIDVGAAARVIDRLQGLSSSLRSGVEGAMDLTGPYAGKLRALWISGYHLGVVRDRTDRALCAFLKRQTGIEHTRWLRDAGDARRVIEALKAWLAREAGVEWPVATSGAGDDSRAVRLAILRAQEARLAAFETKPQPRPTLDHATATETEIDSLIAARGFRLNRELRRRGEAA
jgi:phage gp16-like protein